MWCIRGALSQVPAGAWWQAGGGRGLPSAWRKALGAVRPPGYAHSLRDSRSLALSRMSEVSSKKRLNVLSLSLGKKTSWCRQKQCFVAYLRCQGS